VRAHRIHHALHIFIFYFSCLLHVGGGQGTLPVLVKNVMLYPHKQDFNKQREPKGHERGVYIRAGSWSLGPR
jgi:hypothetical protein